MAVDVNAEVTQERINAMVAAGRGNGATPEASPAGPAPVEVVKSDLPADEPEEVGQPPAKADPAAKVKAEYEEKLKALEEELKNQKAMQSESHKRNGAAARDRQAAEEAARVADDRAKYIDAQVRKMEGLGNGLAQLAKLHPDVAGQVLQTWAQDAGAGDQFQIGSPKAAPQEDPRVAQLQQEIAKLKQDVSGYAFEVNAGAVAATIDRMTIGNTAFELAETLGEMDDVRERIWTAFVKADKENPGAVSPHNPRQINEAIKALVDAEAKRWKKINDTTIKNYREKRKTLNAQAAAPTRGPSVNVRAAPTPTGPNARETKQERERRWEKQFQEVSKPRQNGAAQEI